MTATAIENAKNVVKLALEVGRKDLHKQTVELMAQVAELTDTNTKLAEELGTARAKIDELTEERNLRSKMRFAENAYYRVEPREDGKSTQLVGPYCSRCFDVINKVVRMLSTGKRQGMTTIYRCPECEKVTGTEAIKPPK